MTDGPFTPHARNSDPGTSRDSAIITEQTTLASEVELVAAAVRLAGPDGLTRGELSDGRYWRRFSDAEHRGLIAATDRVRYNAATRRRQTVYVAPEHDGRPAELEQMTLEQQEARP